MNRADFIEPSLENAPPVRTIVRNGRLMYCVHGICIVDTLDEALALIQDRRIAPRRDTDTPSPVSIVRNGCHSKNNGIEYIREFFTHA